jgi:hypothetical protein
MSEKSESDESQTYQSPAIKKSQPEKRSQEATLAMSESDSENESEPIPKKAKLTVDEMGDDDSKSVKSEVKTQSVTSRRSSKGKKKPKKRDYNSYSTHIVSLFDSFNLISIFSTVF